MSSTNETSGQAPNIQINAQYIKDLSFENPNAPRSLSSVTEPPEVGVHVDVKAEALSPTMFEVQMMLRAEAEKEGQTLFLSELVYGGVFTIEGIPKEHLEPLLLIEGPRYLFPFARNILSDMTRDGGFPPLLINPVDFAAMYRQKLAQGANAALPEKNGNAQKD